MVRSSNGCTGNPLDPKGMNLQENTVEVAGQEVDHLHVHLTPHYTGDKVKL
jgi:diadenosine tetraphosphate (Ap4A) HIT family hydrolase